MEDRLMMKRLLSRVKCSVCGHRYTMENIKNSAHRNGLWFFETYCPFCSTKGLVAVVTKKEKVIELVTDLRTEELARFKGKSPVGSDDLLSLHGFLKGFDGDFAALFESE